MKKTKREQTRRAWQYWKLFPNEPLHKIAYLHGIAYSTLSNFIRQKLDIYYPEIHKQKLK